jgi:hypothetical protein
MHRRPVDSGKPIFRLLPPLNIDGVQVARRCGLFCAALDRRLCEQPCSGALIANSCFHLPVLPSPNLPMLDSSIAIQLTVPLFQ